MHDMKDTENLSIRELLRQNFPRFANDELLEAMVQSARWFAHDQEEEIVQAGEFPKWIPMVTRGAIKVSRAGVEDEEIFLYYLFPGQTCAMTLNCCMVEKPSEIRAVAEAGTEYIGLPRQKISEWINQYDDWRNFTLESYDERYQNLMETVDAIAFHRLDERLLQLLRDKSIALGSPSVDVTHRQLAEDLHSSREVISRLLKQLERKGQVELHRNKIELLDF